MDWAAVGRQAARSQMPSQMIVVASIGGAPSFGDGQGNRRRLRMGLLDLLTSRQALAQPMGLRSSDDARRRARSVHGPFESITIRREDRPNMTEMPIDAPPSTNTRAVRLTEIARIFLKIGAMSYGVGIMLGPQA